MAEPFTESEHLAAITKMQGSELTPSFVVGTRIVAPKLPRLRRTEHTSTKRTGLSISQRGYQGFSATSLEHPLSAAMYAPLFQGLSPSQLREVAGAGRVCVFSHNQNIFGEGDPLRSVSMVTSGGAKTVRHSAMGKVMILDLAGPGDVLDGLGCSPGSTHFLEARAVQRCSVFSWELERFESLSTRFPVLRGNSIGLLVRRLRLLEGRVHELATQRVPQRLAKTLLRLSLQASGSDFRSLLDVTGEDLAQMVGTTQSTVSRLLCDWAAQGIIQPGRTAIRAENLLGLIGIAMQAEGAE